MSQFINHLLGERPIRMLIKLLIFSLLIGWLLAKMGWTPLDVPLRLWQFLLDLVNTGFASLSEWSDIFLAGAMIVVPVFIFMRLFKRKND